jgi:hypothetical protein
MNKNYFVKYFLYQNNFLKNIFIFDTNILKGCENIKNN